MGSDRQKVIMCPRGEKTPQVDTPGPKNRRLGEAPHCRFGMTEWRRLANGFSPHSSPRVYYAKADDMQPILILSPLLGSRKRRLRSSPAHLWAPKKAGVRQPILILSPLNPLKQKYHLPPPPCCNVFCPYICTSK